MEWLDWFSVLAGSAALLIAIYLPIQDHRRRKRENDFHKNSIQDAIYDAEIIFRNVSSMTNDYDYVDEETATKRIFRYTRKNIAKINYCEQEIKRHSAFLKLDVDMNKKIKGVLDTLDWFADFYYCDETPSIKQQVTWKKEHNNIDEKIDKLLEVAENM